MLFPQIIFKSFRRNVKQFVRLSSSRNASTEDLFVKPKYTLEEQEKILSVLNDTNLDNLYSYNLSRPRLKNVQKWRNKNGQFNSITEFLEVEGIGEKVFEKVCRNIINNSNETIKLKKATSSRNAKQILTPQINPDLAFRIKNAVGIHLAPTGVSWAKLTCENNEVHAWHFHDFSSLPSKLLPTDTFQLAAIIINKIPVADVYVMESSGHMNIPSNKQAVPIYTQQLELNSMLLALLNTSPKHNLPPKDLPEGDELNYENKVYYLRHRIPARLFRTLVGRERVAATEVISNLLEGLDSLPCTPVNVKSFLKEQYFGQQPRHQDIMGQALLLVISFVDLCIYQNSKSLSSLSLRDGSKTDVSQLKTKH